jgi:phytoene dehydrogenase-like protein
MGKAMISRRDFIRILGMGATSALINWDLPAQAAAGKAGPGQFDAIIIGAGLGGLSCAAFLAVNGFRPLVIEKHYLPGGYASAFTRTGKDLQRYHCEVSLHATAAMAPPLQKLYKDLDILGKLTFVPHKHTWSSRFPDLDFDVPTGLDAFRDALIVQFPAQKKGLVDFFAYWKNLERDMEKFDREGMPPLKVMFPRRFPVMWDIRDKTLGEVLDRHFKDPRLKALICQTWGYYGLPPSRLSAFYYLHPFGEYLKYGGYYLQGTSLALSNALSETIQKHGGTVMLNEKVTEIKVEGMKVTGVKTASGRVFTARTVVSNCAVPETMGMLSRHDVVPGAYRTRLASLQPSLSTFVVWLGLNGDVTKLENRADVILHPGYDDEAVYAASLKGDPEGSSVACMIYDNLIKGFSPEGKSTLSITFLCGYAPWKRFEEDYTAGRKDDYQREKSRIANQLIGMVEKSLIKGLSGMIDMQEAATPLTNRRFTGNTGGAIYGFDQTLDNAFMNRLESRTPIRGLYFASAWTAPGGGHEGALLGGKGAFKSIIEDQR